MSEPRRVLVAPDSFKGTYSAVEVTAALADGLAETGVLADPCPVADGGEGTASVLRRPLGGEWRTAEVTDALISIHVEPDDKAKHSGIVVL